MKRIATITTISIAVIFCIYSYLTWNDNGNPRYMQHRYNKVITQPLASIGFTDAQFKMGLFWFYGSGLEPTVDKLEKAVYWWGKASEKGHEDSVTELEKAQELMSRFEDVSFLYQNVGKYPHEINLFEVPTIRMRLQNLVGNKLDEILRCQVEGPMEVHKEEYIHIRSCFPHECNKVYYIILVSRITSNILFHYRSYDDYYFYSENGIVGNQFDDWK